MKSRVNTEITWPARRVVEFEATDRDGATRRYVEENGIRRTVGRPRYPGTLEQVEREGRRLAEGLIPIFATFKTELAPADTASLAEALAPKWPRQFDITATFADGSREIRRVLLDAPDGASYAGALVSGPRMADGAWSPPETYRHEAEIDGKPATVEIRRAER